MATLKLNDVTTMTESGGTVTMADGVALGTPSAVTLTNATFPAGHIIQTTYNEYNSSQSANTTSSDQVRVSDGSSNYHWTGQITNVGASNHVSVTMAFTAHCNRESTSTGMGFGLFRESSLICDLQNYSNYYWVDNSASKNWWLQLTLTWIDESPATGTNNYYLGYSTSGGGGNNSYTNVQSASNMEPFRCILQEIQR